jgi:uncharacterized protein YndB with AHSA1/START domain
VTASLETQNANSAFFTALTDNPTGAARISLPSDTEVVLTREFNAPRRLVFDAMTKPEHVRRWYGPRRMTMQECRIDLRVGGVWRYVLRDNESGEEHAFSGEYKEIAAPDRLVSTERYEPIPNSDYVVTATFTERDGKTTMRSHLKYQSVQHRDGHLMSGMEPGMQETFNRLDEFLAGQS